MDWGFLYVVLLSIVEIYGDFALRFYAQTNKVSWLVHGLMGYAGVVGLLVMFAQAKVVSRVSYVRSTTNDSVARS